MTEVRTRFDLTPDQIPTAWFNLIPDMVAAGMPPLPPLSPQTKEPVGPADLAPAVPRGADHAGGVGGAVDRHPRRGHRHLPAVEALAAVPRHPAGASAARPRPTSTSSTKACRPRGRTSRTPPCRRPTTTSRRGSAASPPRPGAGQWGSSMAMACSFFGLECDVYMVKASYDQKPYRRIFMETFGAGVVASPSAPDEQRARDPGRAPRLDRLARHRDQRGRGGRGDARRHELRAGQRPGPRPAASDRDRPRGAAADGAGGRAARRDRRLRGRRLELRRALVPVHGGQAAGDVADPLRRHRAGGVPHAHEGALRLRLRRHRADRAHRPDVHAGPRLRAGAGARGRPALPRRRPVAVDAGQARAHGGEGLHAEPDLRGRGPVREDAGDHPGARARATRSRAPSTRRSPRARRARSA